MNSLPWNDGKAKFALLLAALLVLGFAGAATAADVNLINTQVINTDWTLGADWADGQPPSAGNAYHVGNDTGKTLRTPTGGSPVFPGDSLTFHPTGGFTLKLSDGSPATIADLRMNGGTIGLGQGNSTSIIDGVMTVLADSQLNGSVVDRHLTLACRITGGAGLTVDFQSAGGNNLRLTNATNTYTGDWIVRRASLFAEGAGSLGSGNVTIDSSAALDADYDIDSPAATLTLDGAMTLDRDHRFFAVVINGVSLNSGTHTFAELNAAFDATFADGGSGSITVLRPPEPAIGASPAPVDFGLHRPGSPNVTRTLTVTNIGNSGTILTIASLNIEGASFVLDRVTLNQDGATTDLTAPYSGIDLGTTDSLDLSLVLDTATEGDLVGTATLTSNDAATTTIVPLRAAVSNYHIILVFDDTAAFHQEDIPLYRDFLGQIFGGGTDYVYVEAIANKYRGNPIPPEFVADLEAADLVIFARGATSTNYNTFQWNALRTPFMMHNPYLLRNTIWDVVDSNATGRFFTVTTAEAVNPTDPIMNGVTVTGGQVLMHSADTVYDFVGPIDIGNGTTVTTFLDSGTGNVYPWVAYWAPGVEFFDGSGQYAGGYRAMFTFPRAEEGVFFADATADALLLLENTLKSLARPRLLADAAELNFGTPALGAAATSRSIAIINTGFVGTNLQILDVDVSQLGVFNLESVTLNGAPQTAPYTFTLNELARDELKITVSFDPATIGLFDGRLTISSDDPTLPLLIVPVLARVPAPNTRGSRLDPDGFTSLGPLNVASGLLRFDTDALTVTGPGISATGVLAPSASGQTALAAFCFDSIDLGAAATVEIVGGRALALLSQSSATIGANLTVAGDDSVRTDYPDPGVGPAAAARASGHEGGMTLTQTTDALNGPGRGQLAVTAAGRGAGGGGAYGGAGGQGAVVSATSSDRGGLGGAPYGTPGLVELWGGSGAGGGNRHEGTTTNSGGGAGGGAIEIVANSTLTIAAGATISANGGASAGGGGGTSGGGGSGGAILLEAAAVVNLGALEAIGGSAADASTRGGGGGGGGRIAIYYSNTVEAGVISVAAGAGGLGTGSAGTMHGADGAEGTLYIGPPTADAGAALVAPFNGAGPVAAYVLDGSGSLSPVALPLTYAWRVIGGSPNATIDPGTAATARPLVTFDALGAYLVELTVDDGVATNVSVTTVTVVNDAPAVQPRANPPVVPPPATTTTLVGDFVDFYSPAGSYTFAWSLVNSPAGGAVTVTAPNAQNTTVVLDGVITGAYTFQLVVDDGERVGTGTVQIYHGLNEPPVARAIDPVSVAAGGPASLLNASASSDADSGPDPLTYLWEQVGGPAGGVLTIAPDTATLQPIARVTGDVLGRYTVRLTVSDGVEQDTTEVTVEVVRAVTGARDRLWMLYR